MIASSERRAERAKKAAAEEADEETLERLQDEDADEAELLGLLIDFTNRMVKNSGALFASVFHEQLFEQVSRYLSAADSSQPERVTAICILDDVLEHGGAPAAQYIPAFLPYVVQNATHADAEIRQACLYGVGVLATVAPPAVFMPHRDALLPRLVALIEAPDARSDDNYPSTCNAASAIVKLLASPVGNHAGLDAAAMWPRVLSWLPLGGDEDEACRVHTHVMELVQQNRADVIGAQSANLPALVRTFADILHSEVLSSPALDAKIGAFWRQIRASVPAALVEQLVGALPPASQASLAKCAQA